MMLNKKLLVSISVAAALSLGFSACMEGSASPSVSSGPSTPSIDGGVKYPVKNEKTGPYYVNTQFDSAKINHGRVPTKHELEEWNSDIMPDGTGLPEGEGSVEDGEEVYESKCVMCHGDFGSGGGGSSTL